jgi:hypothetical protein
MLDRWGTAQDVAQYPLCKDWLRNNLNQSIVVIRTCLGSTVCIAGTTLEAARLPIPVESQLNGVGAVAGEFHEEFPNR